LYWRLLSLHVTVIVDGPYLAQSLTVVVRLNAPWWILSPVVTSAGPVSMTQVFGWTSSHWHLPVTVMESPRWAMDGLTLIPLARATPPVHTVTAEAPMSAALTALRRKVFPSRVHARPFVPLGS
jgi:hypothetical protein